MSELGEDGQVMWNKQCKKYIVRMKAKNIE
jgi:hypothetical protein